LMDGRIDECVSAELRPSRSTSIIFASPYV
jgi:hypothetical protein